MAAVTADDPKAPQADSRWMTGWRGALAWGIGIALVHRLVLTLWLPLAWSILGAGLNGGNPDFHTARADIPALTSPQEQLAFGVWRRWDAVHYLDLAANGYRAENAGSTVFGYVTPAGIALVHTVIPHIDLAAAIFELIAFSAALVLLIRFCEVYFGDAGLGRWAAVVTALLPLSFFFAAPMSESPFLALSVGALLAGAHKRWLAAGILGALATLTRSQGVLLAAPLGLMLLDTLLKSGITRRELLTHLLWRGLPLALIPAAYLVFDLSRQAVFGLPSLADTYATYSYMYFTHPLEGLIVNLRWFLERPAQAVVNIDIMILVAALLIAFAGTIWRIQRRWPLVAYTWLSLGLFMARVNYEFGTQIVYYSQSTGRYIMVVFPLALTLAELLRRAHGIVRLLVLAGMVLLLLLLSALYTLALAGP
jgi:hypothetical protein